VGETPQKNKTKGAGGGGGGGNNKTRWYQSSAPVNWTIFAKFWLSIFIKRKTLDGHRMPDN